MSKRLLFLLMLMMLPALACNLDLGDSDDPLPTNVPAVIVVTATPTTNTNPIVTATPTQTPPPNNNNNSGNNNNPRPTVPPAFSDMSFSTTRSGPDTTVFPRAVKEVFLRWNYSNVPTGTTLQRTWYRDGVVVASRDEAWSANWGATGRLTHISFFDRNVGLTSGNYTVVISLPQYGTQLTGNFTVAATDPIFDKLTFSTRPDGAAMTSFPYGTAEVFARWNFAGVTAGSVVVREWYRNGVLILTRSEAWQAAWGRDGSISNVSYYNFTSGYGIDPGTYRVVAYMRDMPSARVENTFLIEGNVAPKFTGLRFNTTGNGASGVAQNTFPAGTQEVYAIWDYSSIPTGAQVRRLWKRNGTIIIDRTEAWSFERYGTNGTVTDVKIFDYTTGLATGNYEVQISLVGQAGVSVQGNFTIQASQNPTFGALSIALTPGGTAITTLPAGTQQFYAMFDFANVQAGEVLRTRVASTDGAGIDRVSDTVWSYVSTGRVTNLAIVSPDNPLPAGAYRLTVSLPDKNLAITLDFTVAP